MAHAARAALLVAVAAGAAHADGTLTMRGVYYKERSTRVMQPMLDGMFEAGARGLVTGHLLLDAITSASPSSGAVATAFTERRYEGGLGYAHELDGPDDSFLDVLRLAASAKVSRERDYRSVYAGLRAEAEVAQKNVTLGLGGGVSADRIDASGLQATGGLNQGIKLQCPGDMLAVSASCPLTSYLLFGSASQVLGKNAVVGVSYDLARQDGYLGNAYRQVVVAPAPVAERHPFERTRHAIAASVRAFVPRSKTTLIGAYRYYWDSWDVHAHTPELRIVQEVGRGADAAVRYRYYTQDASFFWQRRYTTAMVPYLTDDPKMSPFSGHTMEAKLGVLGEVFGLQDRWAGARFEGILEYVVQYNRFGNAVVAHAALTLPFDD